jgi:DNA-binding phage protein
MMTLKRHAAAGRITNVANAAAHEREQTMALTRSFRDTVQVRIQREPAFGQALFQEAVQLLMDGDIDTAKATLRDVINATIGFEALAAVTQTPPKSLMRMFSAIGNPQARHLFGVLSALQDHVGVHLQVQAVAEAA